ncbi:flagellar hook-basal body complex protein [Alloyangia pacifica]|uniref:flagellar hook-basal body complex protein n=1 Tax=Alloyangia pacifica TaxID=311180 RepID=UPI001CD6BE0F|nr:flagellar hook-basal body complex protein [Alloyangia pacifica]MCA0995418.1 flagellar hook-basal body complex protein [Alloyangia pacifica]
METTGYTILSRQRGLMREMQLIANNVANAGTTGYRQQGLIFSEYIRQTDLGGSVSMSAAHVRNSSFAQGTITSTGAALDLAIEGEGFFLVQTPAGERLTRNGAFTTNAQGDLVTHDGHPVMSAGGGPVFVPPGADLAIAQDGTISSGGQPIGQIGVVAPADTGDLERDGATMFRAPQGSQQVETPKITQGALESSNVDPILQFARMIEVQRAYELGQSFLDREDQRQLAAIKTLFS